jgi:uncharacterized membrane protein
MESGLLVLGLLGLAAVVGGLVSFFSMFSKGDQKTKLWQFEQELKQLKKQLESLEASLKNIRENISTKQKEVALVAELPPTKAILVEQVSPPNFGVNENEALSEDSPQDTTENIISPEQALDTSAQPSTHTYAPPTPELAPAEPNFIERGFAYAKNWLFGGNTLVRSGIVILFIGVSFLIKYAAEHTQIPIEFRLAGITLAGIALLVVGWRLRDNRAQYAWALQGGGIGVLYLTIFAAMKLYGLMHAGTAFALLIAVAFLSAAIAVLQSALPLAILGFAGGFLAPIFTSTGQGSHVSLFSYYLVLNLAIAFIAYHKSWRPLNVLGFAFTFIIGTLWGASSYTPENFATTEPFLIVHFLLFTLIAVLYAHRQATKASDYVDATLVFGTPIVSFSLQYALLKDSPFGMAYSALALGIFYIGLAWWVLTRKRDTLQFLGECFLALGIGFATLTLPLALDGRWTSAAWAVEGVGLLWVGLRQKRTFPLLCGLALQLLAALAFVYGWGLTGHTGSSGQNMFLGVAFIAVSGWACGALLNRYNTSKIVSNLLAVWGWVWWVGAGLTAIDAFLPSAVFPHAALVFVALTSVLLPTVSSKIKWPTLANLSRLLLPVMTLVLIFDFFESHPFAHYGFYSWLIAFAAYIWLLMRDLMPKHAVFRAALVWMTAIIGGIEWQHYLSYKITSGVWLAIGWGIVPLLIIAGIVRWQKNNADYTTNRAWIWVGAAPLMLFLCVWFMFMSLDSSGSALPLPYVPLLNPLDITLVGIMLILMIWERNIRQHFYKLESLMPIIAGLMGFTLLNGVLLRTLHHWIGTPFQWTAIFDYPVVQMSFTFLWAISAFILMLLAHKRAERMLWVVGAALMGLVVAKIFLLDLAQHGTVERIASFIGAGLMLLVMGYFAPLPPAKSESEQTTDTEAQ